MANSSLRSAVRLAADELAEAVLPAVLSRLQGQTTRLQSLAARITADPQAAVRDPAGVEFLEADQTFGRSIGWCLGVLSAATGTDLLLARRERDGLREMVGLVGLAAPEHPLEPAPSTLPRLTTAMGEGWEVAFLVAFAFLSVARHLPAAAPLRWGQTSEPDGVLITLRRQSPDRTSEALLTELIGLVPGAEFVHADTHLGLRIPPDWIERDA